MAPVRRACFVCKQSPRFLASFVAALCFGLLAAACGGGPTSGAGSQETKDGLKVAVTLEPTDWNYLRNPALTIRQLLMFNVLEPLLDKRVDGTLTPLLAESYTVSKDGLVYTFHIRKATFSNGAPVTADDVVYSLEQSRTTQLQDVSGRLKAVKEISKTGDQTVTVTLSTPSQRFLDAMSTDSGAVIPKGSASRLKTGPIGTGPFVFASWKHGAQVDFERNDHYWGQRPALRTITWRFIGDATTAVNALRAGDIDMIGGFWGSKAQTDSVVGKASGFAKNVIAGPTMVYISLNANDPVFADARVRRAIAFSLDRQAFIDGTNSSGSPTCVFVNPPNEPWKSDKCPYPHDPAKAKQLLTEAGRQGLTLNYTYLAGTEDGVAVVSQGLEQAGFKVKTQALQWPVYLDRVLTKGQYQFTHIAGPQQIDTWKCPGWFTHDCYPAMDALLARADRATNRTEWADLRRQSVELDAERAYLIPAWTTNVVDLYRKGLEGLKTYTVAGEADVRNVRWGTS
ncbi:ABC transporter substrate-binding protein [Kribbella aluminosa]|uniref:ABC transporter substrate-binding protein n=1 Tax=Kribbella aluminosa TaxID=416017 RepID=UPI0031D69095